MRRWSLGYGNGDCRRSDLGGWRYFIGDLNLTNGISSICIFAGSKSGDLPDYAEAARAVGQLLAQHKITLVYGGSGIGLMGVLADAALAAQGRVIGVIPQALVDLEVAHRGLSDLRIVATMHQRKALMAQLAQAFIALPGGIGTMEEFFEIWTWAILGEHNKPFALLNVRDYYAPLLGFLDHAVERGFLRRQHRSVLLVESDPARLLERMHDYRMPPMRQWITAEKT